LEPTPFPWIEDKMPIEGGIHLPHGDKSNYTDKRKRQAEHIERGYEQRGVPEKEAKRRAPGRL
jgi:hypothetical protein